MNYASPEMWTRRPVDVLLPAPPSFSLVNTDYGGTGRRIPFLCFSTPYTTLAYRSSAVCLFELRPNDTSL
jgi:hypothetical protein